MAKWFLAQSDWEEESLEKARILRILQAGFLQSGVYVKLAGQLAAAWRRRYFLRSDSSL